MDWRVWWAYRPQPARILLFVGMIILTCQLLHVWIVIRMGLFVIAVPLVVAGTLLATLMAPRYWVKPTEVLSVGMRWLRTWWAWVTGKMSTWDFIR